MEVLMKCQIIMPFPPSVLIQERVASGIFVFRYAFPPGYTHVLEFVRAIYQIETKQKNHALCFGYYPIRSSFVQQFTRQPLYFCQITSLLGIASRLGIARD